MQSQRLELMMDIAEKELSGLTSIHNELSNTLGEKLMDSIDLIEKIDGNVVLSGIGKSGMIANKIAAKLLNISANVRLDDLKNPKVLVGFIKNIKANMGEIKKQTKKYLYLKKKL